jgi:hypothetical protein
MHPLEPTGIGNMHTETVLEETRSFWQAQSNREVSQEDARVITENMVGFFTMLAQWDTARDCTADSTNTLEVKEIAYESKQSCSM